MGRKKEKEKIKPGRAGEKPGFFGAFPLHVFIFPLYPALFLFSVNTGFVRPLQTAAPLLFSVCGAARRIGEMRKILVIFGAAEVRRG